MVERMQHWAVVLCALVLWGCPPNGAVDLAEHACGRSGSCSTGCSPGLDGGLLSSAADGGVVTAFPLETDELLVNPGMGFTTFHTLSTENYPCSSVVYARWYWSEVEPKRGQYDFSQLDATLEAAHSHGKRVAFRLMPAGQGVNIPPWLMLGMPGQWTIFGFVPDFSNERMMEETRRLVLEIGRRYNGHPDLEHVDIGSMGLWGEWHIQNRKMPEADVRQAYVDMYLQAFTQTPLIMLVGNPNYPADTLQYAVEHGAGWRGDCLGNEPSAGYNEHDFYVSNVRDAHAEGSWQHAPVVFETCWDISQWKAKGMNVKHVLDFALSMHASLVNDKSKPIPEDAWPDVEAFLKKVGYRLVVTRLAHPAVLHPGTTVHLSMTLANRGVAPPYAPFEVWLRLVDARSVVVTEWNPSWSVQALQPGETDFNADVMLDGATPGGDFTVQLGIVRQGENIPSVRLAQVGRGTDGWYAISAVSVVAP